MEDADQREEPAEVEAEGRMDGGSHHRARPLRPRPPNSASLFRRKSSFLTGFRPSPREQSFGNWDSPKMMDKHLH